MSFRCLRFLILKPEVTLLLSSVVSAILASSRRTCLLLAWYLAIWFFDPEYQLPKPHVIVKLYSRKESCLSAVDDNCQQVGFFISVSWEVLTLFGVEQGRLRNFPILHQMTPIIVLAPIIILWAGQGLASITTITFLICFFPIVANTTMDFAQGPKPYGSIRFKAFSQTMFNKITGNAILYGGS